MEGGEDPADRPRKVGSSASVFDLVASCAFSPRSLLVTGAAGNPTLCSDQKAEERRQNFRR